MFILVQCVSTTAGACFRCGFFFYFRGMCPSFFIASIACVPARHTSPVSRDGIERDHYTLVDFLTGNGKTDWWLSIMHQVGCWTRVSLLGCWPIVRIKVRPINLLAVVVCPPTNYWADASASGLFPHVFLACRVPPPAACGWRRRGDLAASPAAYAGARFASLFLNSSA
jgi:hypothetical protein